MKLSWLLLARIFFLCIWDFFLHLFQARPPDYQNLNHLKAIPAYAHPFMLYLLIRIQ